MDSTPIKLQAFARCFAEFPDRLERIMDYCGGQNHTPRWEKFQHVYERILGLPYTAEVAERLHARFEAATTRQIIEAPEIPGAGAWLRWVHQRCETVLLSSTPHEILLEIVSRRGWSGWFSSIQGAPVDKAQWLIAQRHARGLSPHQALFFGDTPEDAQAGRRAGWTFIGVGTHLVDFSELLACRR